jgi:hypothetical protein
MNQVPIGSALAPAVFLIAVRGVHSFARCLVFVGFVLFWLRPIIDMSWCSPPPGWIEGGP